MPAVPASIPTSLKLPGALKQQLEEDAKQMGMSLHAFMVSTLADAAKRKRLRHRSRVGGCSGLFFSIERTSPGEERAASTLASEKNGLRCEHRISEPSGISGFGAPGNVST